MKKDKEMFTTRIDMQLIKKLRKKAEIEQRNINVLVEKALILLFAEEEKHTQQVAS